MNYYKHVLFFFVACLPVMIEGDLADPKTYLKALAAGCIVLKALGSNPNNDPKNFE